MIRRWLSNFIRNNREKLRDIGSKLMIVAIVVFIATILLSATNTNNKEKEEKKDSYRPTETIIRGKDIKEEQYETDNNLAKKFLDFCNIGQLEQAYELLSDDCKEELYPTIEDFEKYYYDNIFDKERQINLQSWISTSDYTVYKIRYTNNMLATGTYNESDIYQDYITIKKNAEEENISIGNLIFCEECNIVTKTDEIEAIVTRKKVYVSDEEYEIQIKNNTDKTILLDNLSNGRTIRLIAEGNTEHSVYSNRIFTINLRLNPGETKTITLRFKKNLSSSNKSKNIKFDNVVKNYYTYIENQENYNDITSIIIDVED